MNTETNKADALPTAGEIEAGFEDILRLPPEELAERIRRKDITPELLAKAKAKLSEHDQSKR